MIGETDFESWDRLWKAFPSDPEVDGEEWLNFSERIQELNGPKDPLKKGQTRFGKERGLDHHARSADRPIRC